MATLAKPARHETGGRELVGLVSVSHALQHLYVAVLPLTYPLVVAEFHVSYTALGLVLGIHRSRVAGALVRPLIRSGGALGRRRLRPPPVLAQARERTEAAGLRF